MNTLGKLFIVFILRKNNAFFGRISVYTLAERTKKTQEMHPIIVARTVKEKKEKNRNGELTVNAKHALLYSHLRNAYGALFSESFCLQV